MTASPQHSQTLPVIVVGAGPVGLTAAIELVGQGLTPIVLEDDTELAWSSRAICISRRSLEILDRIGVGEAFAAKALSWNRARTFYRDQPVFELEMPFPEWEKHPPFVNIQQYYTETFLLERLKALGGVEVRWGSGVVGAVQKSDRVTLTIRKDGVESTLDAAWVVAADGGRSIMRDLLGLKLEGTSYEGRYLIADIDIATERPVERHVWFDPPSNPGSTVILHVQPDHVWRIDYQLRDDEDAEEALKDEAITTRINNHLAMIGETAPWTLHWKSLYRAHCLQLASYRHGRVLLAGDAAHLVPIFGVRGLNSGLDDAHNLGWKLGMVARGEASPALLDTYSTERREGTTENIAQATKSTWFMSPPTRGFELVRDAVLSLAQARPSLSALVNPRQSAAITYHRSAAVTYDGEAGGVGPGEPAPNLKVSGAADAPRLQDLLETRRFSLVVFTAALAADQLAALRAWTAPGAMAGLVEVGVSPDLETRFAADRWPLYLIRPDEHVAARFASVDPHAIEQALSRALGQAAAAMTGQA